jgi:hypothetical protein
LVIKKKKTMKKYICIFSILIFSLSGCIKEKKIIFEDSKAEFDAASYNAKFGATDFTLATRVPGDGRPFIAADPFITRTTTGLRFRINLIGAQRSAASTVNYTTFAVGTSAGASIAYGAPVSATLPILDAVAGTHFTALSGTCTIPANSSFGYIDIPLINPGVSVNETRLLGLELASGGSIAPSVNYRKIVFAISQK